MIVEELISYIACTKCDYGFSYATTFAHCELDLVYDSFFKRYMDRCPHCSTGRLVIVRCVYKLKKNKQKYTARWQCSLCNQTWVQIEHIDANDLRLKSLMHHFMDDESICCPNANCKSTTRRLIGMSRE
jgi:hypothetical protein